MAPCILVSPYGVPADSLPAGTHFVTDEIKFAPLSDEHKSRIVEYLDTIGEDQLSKRVRKKPSFLIPISGAAGLKSITDTIERTEYALRIHRFSLEYFSERTIPMAAFSYDDYNIISHAYDQIDLSVPERIDIELLPGSWDKHLAYLKFVYQALAQAPLLRLAITRMCRARRQGPTPDGIIDLAIGLECLVVASVEIKFQFSLYHSLINCDSVDEREDVFSILQKLYDVRSSTVHGSQPGSSDRAKLNFVKENWERLLQIAGGSLTYYVLFCSQNDPKKWQDHLRSLAMGQARTVEEADKHA